ncbi:MAG: Tex-like N-terminal domain-containing protein, partial [Paludibacteraceae bacterium]
MLTDQIIKLLSDSLLLAKKQILNAIALLEDGATIPFISRYRKEATNGMDEVQLADLKEQYDQKN